MVTDASGNIIIAYENTTSLAVLTKFSPDLSVVWTVTLDHFQLGDSPLAVDASGNIYVGGEDQPANGPTPAVVVQYLADGTSGWRQTIGASLGTNIVNRLAVGPSGTVYALGYSSGQLPQQPASAAGGGFLLQYDPNGVLLRASQSTAISSGAKVLQLDPAGNSFILDLDVIMKLDASFAPIWTTSHPGDMASVLPTSVALSADGTILYDFEPTVGVVKRNASSGAAIWQESFSTQTAILDAIEGEKWTGAFTDGTPVMLSTTDAVYVAGIYSNNYMNGSSPPPYTTPGYILRLDLSGNQVWFRQFESAPNVNLPTNIIPLIATSLALSGPNKLVVYKGGFANNGGTLFLINTADGSGP